MKRRTFSEDSFFHFCFVFKIGGCDPYLDAVGKMLHSFSQDNFGIITLLQYRDYGVPAKT